MENFNFAKNLLHFIKKNISFSDLVHALQLVYRSDGVEKAEEVRQFRFKLNSWFIDIVEGSIRRDERARILEMLSNWAEYYKVLREEGDPNLSLVVREDELDSMIIYIDAKDHYRPEEWPLV